MLFRSLNVFPIQMPLLRERGTDIELLAQHFLDELNKQEGTAKTFAETAIAALYAHSWPGNVRELKNYVQRAFIMSDKVLDVAVAPERSRSSSHESLLTIRIGSTLDEVSRRLIEATLNECGGAKRKAAEILGISLKTLYNRLAVYQGAKEDDSLPQRNGLRTRSDPRDVLEER